MIDIYGTLGPACADREILKDMLSLGMTGMRLNLSHMSLEDAAPMLKLLHGAADDAGVRPQLLIDMQGPELRIGVLKKPLELKEGDVLQLTGLFPETVLRELSPGMPVLLDDSKLLLRVAERPDTAEVVRGGVLMSRKSIAVPGLRIQSPAVTAADRENLFRAKEFGVTAVMQPFVRSPQDLADVRAVLNEAGCGDIRLFAKIENLDGIAMIDRLIPEADEIVIARGDLGNAVPLWKLPEIQKRIAKKCRQAGRAFMVVTQMLASMEQNAVPTRAEVSDIFNACLDGASSVMVTGETAAGKYPVEVIRYLVNTVRTAAAYQKGDK